jgi:hypothetical protein
MVQCQKIRQLISVTDLEETGHDVTTIYCVCPSNYALTLLSVQLYYTLKFKVLFHLNYVTVRLAALTKLRNFLVLLFLLNLLIVT